MDSRRFQEELRDVYAQLSRQSTGSQAQVSTGSAELNGEESANCLEVPDRGAMTPAAAPLAEKNISADDSGQASGGVERRANSEIAAAAPSSSKGVLGLDVGGGWGSGDGYGYGDVGLATAVGEKFRSPSSSGVRGGQGAMVTASPNAQHEGADREFIGARLMKRGASALGAGAASKPDASSLDEHEGGSPGKRRKKSKRSERSSFYPSSYFEWTEELMAKEHPERSTGALVAAIFELGLKHSSPKVLMKLMPPKADRLTTEHIKSRLQKYRLHAHRSKDEFLDFFNLRLKAKFKEFQEKEGWRNISPRHGQEDDDESDYDAGKGEEAGAGVDAGGSGGEDGAPAGPEAEVAVALKVDGKMVGEIRDLGARCVREQFHLQEIMKRHISAQVTLQAAIHEHLTSSAADDAVTPGGGTRGSSQSVRRGCDTSEDAGFGEEGKERGGSGGSGRGQVLLTERGPSVGDVGNLRGMVNGAGVRKATAASAAADAGGEVSMESAALKQDLDQAHAQALAVSREEWEASLIDNARAPPYERTA